MAGKGQKHCKRAPEGEESKLHHGKEEFQEEVVLEVSLKGFQLAEMGLGRPQRPQKAQVVAWRWEQKRCSKEQQFSGNAGKCGFGQDWKGRREMKTCHVAKRAFGVATWIPWRCDDRYDCVCYFSGYFSLRTGCRSQAAKHEQRLILIKRARTS